MKRNSLKTTAAIAVVAAFGVLAARPVAETERAMQTEPYIGEIVMFGGNFAPRGWALCDGQLLQISQHTALFSILGTTYGGDGRTTFALPDLRGRAPLHAGQGPGLTNRPLGGKGGTEQTQLTTQNLPPHRHLLYVNPQNGTSTSPVNNVPAADVPVTPGAPVTENYGVLPASPSQTFHANAVSLTGDGQPANNMQPYGTVNYIIALQGVFPSRN